jgi:excisionase family DNA binding protein
MTISTDLAGALETYIREEVARQVEERFASIEATPPPEIPTGSRTWLSTAEAAARAGRHSRTIADACRTGELVAVQRGAQGSWRIHEDSLDAWLRGDAEPLPTSGHSLPRYFNTAGAARYANCSRDTIAKACQSGELFATQRVKGGTWAIRPASLDSWLDGSPDPHREQVERWQRGPKQPLKPRKRRPRPTEPDPDGPAAA